MVRKDDSVYVSDADEFREVTDTEQRAINLLKCAIKAIQNTPDGNHKAITNDCDAMDLAINSVRRQSRRNRKP